ncbi:hypothetical protein H0N96_03010 [Candidatus Micrarchaeota archaeon]|nr:hypothetical protein [Candidatus Micrarchaeota archaeon]
MKLFKHGEVLAIVMPESLRAKTGAKEGDDYSWFEAEPSVFILVEKSRLNDLTRQGAVAALANKLADGQTQAQHDSPVVTRASEVPAVTQAQPRSAPFKTPHEGEVDKNLIQQLNSVGFLILSNEMEAKVVSMRLESDVKMGRVLGIRGFDKKYYVVTREFYDALSKKLLKALSGKKEENVAALSESLKAPQEACIAVLYLMKEAGEVIERKRGAFTLVK